MKRERYELEFPEKANDYNRDRFQYIGGFDFTFDDVQKFLNSYRLYLEIKEVRYKEYYDNSNGRHFTGNDGLRKVVIAVPMGTVLPEILPYDGDKEINITTVFRKLVCKHILSIKPTII